MVFIDKDMVEPAANFFGKRGIGHHLRPPTKLISARPATNAIFAILLITGVLAKGDVDLSLARIILLTSFAL